MAEILRPWQRRSMGSASPDFLKLWVGPNLNPNSLLSGSLAGSSTKISPRSKWAVQVCLAQSHETSSGLVDRAIFT